MYLSVVPKYIQSTNLAYIPLILPILQKAIFCSNHTSDKILYNICYLGLVPSYKKDLYEMGVACKLSWPHPLDWKITSFAKLGVATMILKPHPYPFGSKQLNIRATDDITTITYSYCFPKIFYVKFEILEKMLFMLWNYSFFQIWPKIFLGSNDNMTR